ncbi:hypothetical protein QVD17_30492 [Tagetes erecta]|uniref:Uncharacterized protein n=1 Tax=Tagetes erecta TaxID=13708 RepID=A0AAD8K499_TARER|nr:hypothetical protein QVD17_30492 [Tagetes erecta]
MESSNLINKVRNIDGRPILKSILKNSNVSGSSGDGNPNLVAKDDEKVDNLVAKEDAKVDHVETMDFAGKFKEEKKVNFRRLDPVKQMDDVDVVLPREYYYI